MSASTTHAKPSRTRATPGEKALKEFADCLTIAQKRVLREGCVTDVLSEQQRRDMARSVRRRAEDLTRRDYEVRLMGIRLLVAIGPPAVDTLLALLHRKPSRPLQVRLVAVLTAIGQRLSPALHHDFLLEFVRLHADPRNPIVQLAYAEGIARLREAGGSDNERSEAGAGSAEAVAVP